MVGISWDEVGAGTFPDRLISEQTPVIFTLSKGASSTTSHLPPRLPLLVYLHCTTELSTTSQDQVTSLWVDSIDHWLIFTFSLPTLLWAILRPFPFIPLLASWFYLSRGSSIYYQALFYSQLQHVNQEIETYLLSQTVTQPPVMWPDLMYISLCFSLLIP